MSPTAFNSACDSHPLTYIICNEIITIFIKTEFKIFIMPIACKVTLLLLSEFQKFIVQYCVIISLHVLRTKPYFHSFLFRDCDIEVTVLFKVWYI